MAAYPTDIPIEQIRNVIDHTRNGTVQENLNDFAHSIWVIQGYAQRVMLGEPTPGFSLTAQADFDAVAELEKIVSHAESGVTAQLEIPWHLILNWALQELLRRLGDRF